MTTITAEQARTTTTPASLLAVAKWNDDHAHRDPTGRRVTAKTTLRRRQQAAELRLVAAEMAANDNVAARVAA